MAKKWTKQQYDPNDRNGGVDIADELMRNIRAQDAIDMYAAGGDGVFEICSSIQYSSETYVYRGEDGEILCVMGISKYVPEAAGRCVYMLGTNAINSMSYYKQLLITEARKVIGEWLEKYGLVFNAVNEQNEKSIRWLTRLGAVWLPEKVKTINGTFVQFVITERSFNNV